MREEATHMTVALGTVYLLYSAFFVTIEIPLVNLFVKYCILSLYVGMGSLFSKYVRKNIVILKGHMNHSQVNDIPALLEALQLKT
mmetsp:Transcript_16629/g.15928  ORF Transcript_16629/g.15928 Transcript_16629/m.15928 type:complete len:85 (+) Transcript_16629:456-710(+)